MFTRSSTPVPFVLTGRGSGDRTHGSDRVRTHRPNGKRQEVQQVDPRENACRAATLVDDDHGRALGEQLLERRDRGATARRSRRGASCTSTPARRACPRPSRGSSSDRLRSPCRRARRPRSPAAARCRARASARRPRAACRCPRRRRAPACAARCCTTSSTRPSMRLAWKKPLSRIHLSSTNLVM